MAVGVLRARSRRDPAWRRPAVDLAARVLPIVGLMAVWHVVVAAAIVDRTFLPAPVEVASALWRMTRSGEIVFDLFVSMFRSFAGLAVGCIVGVALGLVMATSRSADRFFGPLVATTYSLPKTALVPLFILWFGIGHMTAIVSVALACLLPVVVSTCQGVRSVPQVVVWSAQAMGTPRGVLLYRVLLPAAMASILTGVRIALGFSFVLTLSAEMIAAKSGIGKLIFFYGESGGYAFMFAGIAAVVAVAFAADRALVAFSNHLLRWHDTVAAGGANA